MFCSLPAGMSIGAAKKAESASVAPMVENAAAIAPAVGNNICPGQNVRDILLLFRENVV